MSQPGSLGPQLRRLRKTAGLTQAQLAARLGWTASAADWREPSNANARAKISKIENGRQLPAQAEIQAWCQACGQPAAAADLALALDDELAAYRSYGHVQHGAAPTQEEYNQLVGQAAVVRNLAPTVIPGYLQTAGYARALFEHAAMLWGIEDIDAAVQTRLARQETLYNPDKRFAFLVTEAALGLLPCPPAVMLGQLAFLERFLDIGLENVTFGIIPLYVRLPVMPTTDVLLLDGQAIVETFAGEVRAGELDSAKYAEVFEMLTAVARTGDGARQLIVSAAARLRSGESE
jgi:transcriptional regulator with XRE-family HTH domain